MKRKQLIQILTSMGFALIRSSKHDIYSNGSITVILPQHKEVDRYLAKDTLKLIQYPKNVCEINYFVNKAA